MQKNESNGDENKDRKEIALGAVHGKQRRNQEKYNDDRRHDSNQKEQAGYNSKKHFYSPFSVVSLDNISISQDGQEVKKQL